MRETIEVGYQTFVSDGDEEFGAIREISPDGLVVYVENAGEFRVPLDAVEAVHSQKVIFDCSNAVGNAKLRIGAWAPRNPSADALFSTARRLRRAAGGTREGDQTTTDERREHMSGPGV